MTLTLPNRRRTGRAFLTAVLCAIAAYETAAKAPPSFTSGTAIAAPDPHLAQATAQPPKPASPADRTTTNATGGMTIDRFLDKLMMAESGGRATARNPRSTALGPFQFIASTWLQVAHRALADDIANLQPVEILALRTDPAVSRRAAKIYTEDNAAYLVSQGRAATFQNLRLAFLVGPGGAARVLAAQPEMPVVELLGAVVMGANPFMIRMTAAELIARCAHDIDVAPGAIAGVTPDEAAVARAKLEGPSAPPSASKSKIAIRCALALPSCRRWLALRTRKASRPTRASRTEKQPTIRR